jgi:hypothetical protein
MTQQGAKVLIFCETKRGCDDITRSLRNDGWPALALHGDKSQKERDWVLAEFKSNRHPLMLATDVAARGLGRRMDACCMLCMMVLVACALLQDGSGLESCKQGGVLLHLLSLA